MTVRPLPHLLSWNSSRDDGWHAHVRAACDYYVRRERISEVQRHLALLFFNSSLRTRTSMEVAGAQLGAQVTTIVPGSGVWGFEWEDGKIMDGDKAEHIHEAIGVLSRYYDAIGVRAFASGTDYLSDRDDVLLRRIVSASTAPIINLESAFWHPCQALADAATLCTHFGGGVRGRKFVLCWAYHPKALPMAVPNSTLIMAARLGMQVTVVRPDGFELDEGVMASARSHAARHHQTVEETSDRAAACHKADVIYAKAWGGRLRYVDQAAESSLRLDLTDWRITAELMDRTNNGVFMHCLPVRRGVVVDDAVLDSRQAIHLLQAEFRLHAQKAILAHIWGL